MFAKEDFELPLEKQLRLRIIKEEIDSCTDVDALRDNLKQCAETLQTYQHLLNVVLKKQIESELVAWNGKIVEEVNKVIDADRRSKEN